MVNLGFLNTSRCVFINIISRRFITSTMINYKVKNSCFYIMIFCFRQRSFKCNVEGRSRNQYCCGKKNYYILCVCVSVALVIQHAKNIILIILSSVACLALPYSFTLSHNRLVFRKVVVGHKVLLLISSIMFV